MIAAAIGASCFVAGIVVTLTGSVAAEAATETRVGHAARVTRTFEHAATSPLMRPGAFDPTPTPQVTDDAREALLGDDPATVKALLLPVVASGMASDDDVRLLTAACDGLKDRACLDFLKGH